MDKLIDLLDKKQNEYLSYFLRYKLYTEPSEKKKMKDICLKIKKTILDISFKNQSPCIFSSESLKEKRVNRFLNKKGIPNLTYRDEYQEKMKGFWDKHYIYSAGSKIEHEGSILEIKWSFREFPKRGNFGRIEDNLTLSNGQKVNQKDIEFIELKPLMSNIDLI